MSRPSNRDRIVEAGLRVMFRKGYIGAGVRDIVADAGVPLGSYTNHFRSKDAFAAAVLDHYVEHVRQMVAQTLGDTTQSPRARLRNYLDLITSRLATDGFRRGCLIGDLSLEAAPLSDALRERLGVVFRDWAAPFAECIAEGQARGDIATEFAPGDLAEFLLASWQGAILRMKVEQSAAPLERFKTIAFATVFKEPN
jgi:TetR/AcrR family transcriptional regulator, transcriptional repressor for nem operon